MALFDRFRRQKRAPQITEQRPVYIASQARVNLPSFIDGFGNFVPQKFNLAQYEMLRQLIPLADSGIQKLAMLTGTFKIHADRKGVQARIDKFIKNVPINWFGKSMYSWVYEMADAAYTYGMAGGESVVTRNGHNRLMQFDSKTIRFKRQGAEGLALAQETEWSTEPILFQRPEFIHYLAFDRRNGHPQGYPLFHSSILMAQMFTRISEAIRNLSYRVADPMFVVWVKAPTDPHITDANAPAIAGGLQNAITEAMKAKRYESEAKDIYAGIPDGEIHIDMLGAGGEKLMESIKFPARFVIEQLCAAMHTPPTIWGLYDWPANYNMSEFQADMFEAFVQRRRDALTPVIEKILFLELALTGDAGAKYKIKWEDISIKAEKEVAEARKLNAEAMEKELKSVVFLYDMGYFDEQMVLNRLVEIGAMEEAEAAQLNSEELQARLQEMRNSRLVAQAGADLANE